MREGVKLSRMPPGLDIKRSREAVVSRIVRRIPLRSIYFRYEVFNDLVVRIWSLYVDSMQRISNVLQHHVQVVPAVDLTQVVAKAGENICERYRDTLPSPVIHHGIKLIGRGIRRGARVQDCELLITRNVERDSNVVFVPCGKEIGQVLPEQRRFRRNGPLDGCVAIVVNTVKKNPEERFQIVLHPWSYVVVER